VIIFRRLDGTYGRVKRLDCDGWPATRFTFGLAIVEAGSERSEVYAIDTYATHRADVEPSLFRTPGGEWFRRTAWHEDPRPIPMVPLYLEVDQGWARDWLALNCHEIPGPVTKAKKTPGGRQPEKAQRALGIYIDAVSNGETPPPNAEIARMLDCRPGTVSRAIQDFERMRIAFVKPG
jgi:hypothetical protein